MSDFHVPTAEEKDLMEKNGINPEGMAVHVHSDNAMIMLNTHTRNEVALFWEHHTGTKGRK